MNTNSSKKTKVVSRKLNNNNNKNKSKGNNKRKSVVPLQTQNVASKNGLGNMRSSFGPASYVRSYQHCRLNPFGSSNTDGLPDSSSVRRLIKDIRVGYNVTIGASGGFMFFLVPELPHGIFFKDVANNSSGLVVNGVSLSGLSQGPGSVGGWYAPILPEWTTWNAASPLTTSTPNPWGATKVRLLTQAARVIYTGTVVNASGYINVQPVTIGMEDAEAPSNNVILNVNTGGVASSVPNYASGVVRSRLATINSTIVSMSPGTVTLTAVEGMFVTLRKASSANNWQGILSPFIIQETNVATVALNGTGQWNASCFYDNNWDSPLCSVQGATVGTTFRVEMAICLEIEPDGGSVLRDYAKVPKPATDAQVRKPEIVLSNMPAAGNLSFGDKLIAALEYVPSVINATSSIAGLFI